MKFFTNYQQNNGEQHKNILKPAKSCTFLRHLKKEIKY